MRLIDADELKAAHGMKDDCADCDKELRGKSRSCEFDRIYSLMDFCGCIDDAPTIEPEQRWIPCSERLPDMWDERYLVSLAWGGIGVMEYKSTGFHNYGSFTPVPIESVIAWMPLPEPYKEGVQP